MRVLLDAPEPALRHKIETALTGKNVRLASIQTKYPGVSNDEKNSNELSADLLDQLKPVDLFSRVYQAKYHSEVPENIQKLFNQVAQEVSQND